MRARLLLAVVLACAMTGPARAAPCVFGELLRPRTLAYPSLAWDAPRSTVVMAPAGGWSTPAAPVYELATEGWVHRPRLLSRVGWSCQLLADAIAGRVLAVMADASIFQIDADGVRQIGPPGAFDARPITFKDWAFAFDSARGRIVGYFGDPFGHGTPATWEFDGESWALVSLTVPHRRADVTMAYSPALGRTVLFGGSLPSGDLGDTWMWDGTSWEPVTGPGPTARWGAGMAFDTGLGKLVLYGGRPDPTFRVYAFDGTWQELPGDGTNPGEVLYASLVHDPVHGRMVLGKRGPYGPQAWAWSDGRWTPLIESPFTGAPGIGRDHAAAFDRARSVLVITGGMRNYNQLADTWEFDGVRWRRAADSPPVSGAQRMVFDQARAVCLLLADNGTYTWDGATWERVASSGPSAGLLAYDSERGVTVALEANETWEWNGQQWAHVSPSPPLTATPERLAYDPARRVTLALDGGMHVWAFNGSSWTRWPDGPTPPSDRRLGLFGFHPSLGAGLLFGGVREQDGFVLADAWAHDGTGWTQVAASALPRSTAAFVGNEGAGTMLTYGGADYVFPEPTDYDETLEFSVVPQPSGRQILPVRVRAGATARVKVEVEHAAGALFQWWRGDQPLANAGRFRGVLTPELTISRVELSDAEAMRLEVSGYCGVSSVVGVGLVVLCEADYDLNDQTDFFDYLEFISLFASQDAGADFNGDGQVDFFDYLDFVAAFERC